MTERAFSKRKKLIQDCDGFFTYEEENWNHQVRLFAGYRYQEAKTSSELLAYYYYHPSPKATVSHCETAVQRLWSG